MKKVLRRSDSWILNEMRIKKVEWNFINGNNSFHFTKMEIYMYHVYSDSND